MSCSISIFHNDSKVQFTDKADASFLNFIKEGAEVYFADYSQGTLLLQKIPDGDYTFWYSQHITLKKVDLRFFNNQPILILQVALQGLYKWKFENIDILSMKEGEINLIYLPYGTSSLQINNAAQVTMLDIVISPFYLNQFADNYPVLKRFLKKINLDEAAVLNLNNIKGSENLLTKVNQLINCRFSKALRKLYFDARVMDIFLEMLDQISSGNLIPFILSSEEEDRILKIRDMLQQHPHLHFTIPKLAKKALLNEFKLKKGFKQLTGTSIFDFHFKVRMKKARELLLNTNASLEEIAEQIGYEHVSSFIAAFKELNNCTPTAFRKRNKGL